MAKIRFSSVYILTIAVLFLVLGGYTEWQYLYHSAPAEGGNDNPLRYQEFLHLIFFFFGFLTLSAIYFLEKREKKSLSSDNLALKKEMGERRKILEERVRLIQELQEVLAEVKTLSGLLPICASCKRIRDDKGYCYQLESYISDHSEAEFSHGICPECAKNLYPQIYK